jgi:hypothetical protein
VEARPSPLDLGRRRDEDDQGDTRDRRDDGGGQAVDLQAEVGAHHEGDGDAGPVHRDDDGEGRGHRSRPGRHDAGRVEGTRAVGALPAGTPAKTAGEDEESADQRGKDDDAPEGRLSDIGHGAHPDRSADMSVMSVSRSRCSAVATAKPIAISTVIAARTTMIST